MLKRCIWHLFIAVCTVLFVAVSILWIRSHYRVDGISFCQKNSRWHIYVGSIKGSVYVNYTTVNHRFGESSFRRHSDDPSRYVPYPGMWRLGAFGYTDQTTTYFPTTPLTKRERVLEFPDWSIFIATAMPLAHS